MIFVTVGTHEYPFDRLIRAADELAGMTDEEVVIQRGSSSLVPQHARYFDWATLPEMEAWLGRASAVISHAGAGTIIMTIKHGSKMVLTPRLAAFGEVMNDHQMQLARSMERKGYAVVVPEPSGQKLLEAVARACAQGFPAPDASPLVEAIRATLGGWEAQRRGGRRI